MKFTASSFLGGHGTLSEADRRLTDGDRRTAEEQLKGSATQLMAARGRGRTQAFSYHPRVHRKLVTVGYTTSWVCGCARVFICYSYVFTSKGRVSEGLVHQVRLGSWERRRGRRGDRWTGEVGIQSHCRVTQPGGVSQEVTLTSNEEASVKRSK